MIEGTSMRSAAVLRTIVQALGRLGVDVNPLLEQAGVERERLQDDALFLPVELHNRFWGAAAECTGDDLIGTRVAELISLDIHQVIGAATRNSATLGDAIVRLSRFGALLGADFEVSLEVRSERAIVRAPRQEGTDLGLHGTLCQLASLLLLGRKLTGVRLVPVEVHCIHPSPPFRKALEDFFEAPVAFDTGHNAIVFESRYLHLPVLGHDVSRCESVDAEAELLLRRISHAPSIVRAVEGLLSLGLGSDSLKQLSAALDLNERTITRKLSAEGTSYAQLRDRVRLRRAKEYLERTRLPVHEIGLMLGFSDGTAFARAFRRWTGSTPRTHRAAAASADAPGSRAG